MNQQGPVRPNKMQKTYRVDQKKGDLNKNGHNSSEIHQRGEKLVCFRKFSIIAAGQAVGTKPMAIFV